MSCLIHAFHFVILIKLLLLTYEYAACPISVDNGTFSWGHGEEDKPILKNINLKVKEKSLVAVVGTVGSGKSSLCSAMLGEMEKNTGRVNIKVRTLFCQF